MSKKNEKKEQNTAMGMSKATRNKIKALSYTKSYPSMRKYVEQLIDSEIQLLAATDYNDYRTILRHLNKRQR